MRHRPERYRTSLEDSARWHEFPFRPGDIVISAPSKSGTTWMQMICALLIFQDTELPGALTQLSPWLDTRLRPTDEVLAQLAAQPHRRFIKTHTPLDGIPEDPDVTYVVVARDPRDVAVSLRHQAGNLHRGIFQRRRNQPVDGETARSVNPNDEHDALVTWVGSDDPPQRNLVTLRGLSWHVATAWPRRTRPNVHLVHYSDLSDTLEPEMRRLAELLHISIAEPRWGDLVAAARFDSMRQRSATLVPDEQLGLYRDAERFFRSGTSGEWREWFTAEDHARYRQRVAQLLPADVRSWLHRDSALAGLRASSRG